MKRVFGSFRAFALAGLAAAMAFAAVPAIAQDVFFTQSGGRGLQNAKMSARMSKAENDITDVQAELAKVQPFAKEPMATCNDDGSKLRWTGSSWSCDEEIDPTVQSFAKKALPSCAGGQLLSVTNGEFDCTNSGFVSNEIDPTVQTFAKAPLPSCGASDVLTVTAGGALSCVPDNPGLTVEADPFIHPFARTDTATIQNCGAGFVLTMNGDRLTCVADVVGLTFESDPHVQDFARNDISGSALAACATGEVLRAVDVGGKVFLQCEGGASALAEVLALNDLSDVDTSAATSNTVLMYQGGRWVAAAELDPNVQGFARTTYTLNTCAAGQVITYDGSVLSCTNDAGGSADPLDLSDLADVNLAGLADKQFLQWNAGTSKWVPGTVQQFAQDTLPTCAAGSVLTGDGSALSCVADAGGAGDPLALDELSDVVITAAANDEVLRFNGTNWVNSSDKIGTTTNAKWCYFTASDIVCDRDTPAPMPAASCNADEYVFWNGSAWSCTNIATGVGNSLALDNLNDVSITTPGLGQLLTYDGSGWVNLAPAVPTTIAQGDSQVVVVDSGLGTVQASVDGVAIWTATGGNLGVRTVAPNATLDVNGLVSATNLRLAQDLYVGGSLFVSGSQSIDGVIFANGGVSATGAISATNFYGDGSGLTNVTASGVNWYNVANIPTQVQAVSNSGSILMTEVSATRLYGQYVSATNGTIGSLSANAAGIGSLNATGISATDHVNTLYVSATNGYIGALTGGTGILTSLTTTAGLATDGDLTVRGNLYVSGSQSIDGVIFANGGVSATGAISATNFYGDGSGLTNVTASGVNWYNVANIPTQVQAVSNSGSILMTEVSATRLYGQYVSATNGTIGSLSANAAGIGSLNATGISATDHVNTLYVSATNGYIGALTGGTGILTSLTTTAGLATDGDLTVRGNLYVSGSQSIDGVIFANGGVSATGAISATNFYGDGSGLTNVTASGVNWYNVANIPTGVQNISTTALDVAELQQLQNIGTSVLPASVWGNLAYLNQSVSTTSTVTFANLNSTGYVNTGTLQASGIVSAGSVNTSGTVMVSNTVYADAFVGDGAGLSNLPASAVNAAGNPGELQIHANNGGFGASSTLVLQTAGLAEPNLKVAGTVQVATTVDTETCAAGKYGMIRMNPTTKALEVCRE
ncbi:MAG: hypothetical protein H6922_05200 [Pseudomonadaceae bacterium]|nr:hypothetical protein [Pseudomonadaceae bacterium]